MTLDHKQRRLRHKIHLFVSFLGLLLRETDQKRVIYVNLKKNGENDHFCAPVHATGPCLGLIRVFDTANDRKIGLIHEIISWVRFM